MRLKSNFFHQPTLKVAEELLGCILVRKVDGQLLKGIIIETEAYIGKNDPACHASRGKTKRNQVMFEKGGVAYVYFTYGMYHCLNIVTEQKDFPSAVLIRAIKPISNIAQMKKNRKKFGGREVKDDEIANGPGKLCVAMNIDLNLNGENIVKSNKLWIEKNPTFEIKTLKIKKTSRIGISKGKSKLWRFLLK